MCGPKGHPGSVSHGLSGKKKYEDSFVNRKFPATMVMLG